MGKKLKRVVRPRVQFTQSEIDILLDIIGSSDTSWRNGTALKAWYKLLKYESAERAALRGKEYNHG
jgi:hypothetical protein